MMSRQTIDVRDLKSKATQVLRDVRENGAEYVVTVDGKPVAVLRPYAEDDDRQRLREILLREMEERHELSRLVSENWTSPKTALEILEEVRDDTW